MGSSILLVAFALVITLSISYDHLSEWRENGNDGRRKLEGYRVWSANRGDLPNGLMFWPNRRHKERTETVSVKHKARKSSGRCLTE
ncbi:hypothetical protein YC2023_027709 [Brassica napus]